MSLSRYIDLSRYVREIPDKEHHQRTVRFIKLTFYCVTPRDY